MESNVHKSDSSAQRSAERHLLSSLGTALEARFVGGAPLRAELGVEPDGVDPDKKIVVEVFARLGALKSAQVRKVRADVLKLAYVRKKLGPEWRAVICFACNEAAASLTGRSWAAEAAREFGVDIAVHELPEDVRQSVLDAQLRQRMVNASDL